MKEFNVLTLARYLTEHELDLVVSSFSELYHKVTFKHHKRIKLKVICSMESAESVMNCARVHKVSSNVELLAEKNFEEENWTTIQPSVLFIPTDKRVGKLTRNTLSQGIPIVSYQNESISEYVDNSCGMLVRKQNTSLNKDAFSRVLSMLYFDPEVIKLLKKGAEKKYQEISGHRNQGAYHARPMERKSYLM